GRVKAAASEAIHPGLWSGPCDYRRLVLGGGEGGQYWCWPQVLIEVTMTANETNEGEEKNEAKEDGIMKSNKKREKDEAREVEEERLKREIDVGRRNDFKTSLSLWILSQRYGSIVIMAGPVRAGDNSDASTNLCLC
ncbi:hypothetical protein BX616_004845, partial [Lobosporangium transversale]